MILRKNHVEGIDKQYSYSDHILCITHLVGFIVLCLPRNPQSAQTCASLLLNEYIESACLLCFPSVQKIRNSDVCSVLLSKPFISRLRAGLACSTSRVVRSVNGQEHNLLPSYLNQGHYVMDCRNISYCDVLVSYSLLSKDYPALSWAL